ncbi:MAG: site-2 protease family protein [Thermovirga sp.]|nr:site-2 protease family protein [Thermovirga sp.]
MHFPALGDLILSIPAVLWAITFHEFCHGYVAFKLGDPTAMRAGRLTLNPLAHLDPIGALMLLFFRFGWAKPVPIDTRYFKNPKRDIALVSIAGVAGNFLTASFCGLLARVIPGKMLILYPALGRFIVLLAVINLGLGVFNLIPIPPLDGSKLLYLVLPPRWLSKYFWLERYSFLILIVLVVSGAIQAIMSPLVSIMLRIIF